MNPIRLVLLALIAASVVACSDMLEATDKTAILDDDLNNAQGAELLRRAALSVLFDAMSQGSWASGLFADEFITQQSATADQSSIASRYELFDRRASADEYQVYGFTEGYDLWQQLWVNATPAALRKLESYAPPGARQAYVGEMFAVRGFAATRLSEDFCPGFPLHETAGYQLVYGAPLSTDQALGKALAAFDSAVTWASDSARILNLARVGRGRALLDLGRFAEAANAVAAVPTNYVYQTEYSTTTDPRNWLAGVQGWQGWGDERSVADKEGGNGLDFVTANDPRVKTTRMGTARNGVTPLYGLVKYPSQSAGIVVASGIEARLIEAEAALKANDPNWLVILNSLRASQINPPMAALTDPGSQSARENLLFRERAFWLFATGHRLGDLRRLVRWYGRGAESVFPSGAYWRGGSYTNATSLPFDKKEQQYSPGVTGCSSS